VSRKGAFWAVLMVLIFIVMLYVMESTNWQRQDMVSGSKLLREVSYPFQKGAQVVSGAVSSAKGYLKENEALRKENEELKALLAEHAGQLLEMQDIKKENQRLAGFLEYKNSHSDQYLLSVAQVIGRDPSNWYQTIIINQGAKDGLEPDMPVITPAGLVGRIVGVTPNTAEVLLLVDNESAVGARLLENRITPGVVQGNGQSEVLEMVHLSHDEEVEVGNTVLTSGFSSIFPKGLLIGTIEEVTIDSNALTKNALIRPFVDFDQLEEVMVICQVLAEDTEEGLENPGYADTGGADQ
jgi:rod shape-determining protein MreC